jgi:hypothetical protein
MSDSARFIHAEIAEDILRISARQVVSMETVPATA